MNSVLMNALPSTEMVCHTSDVMSFLAVPESLEDSKRIFFNGLTIAAEDGASLLMPEDVSGVPGRLPQILQYMK